MLRVALSAVERFRRQLRTGTGRAMRSRRPYQLVVFSSSSLLCISRC
jgi:hypothetical protein